MLGHDAEPVNALMRLSFFYDCPMIPLRKRPRMLK